MRLSLNFHKEIMNQDVLGPQTNGTPGALHAYINAFLDTKKVITLQVVAL